MNSEKLYNEISKLLLEDNIDSALNVLFDASQDNDDKIFVIGITREFKELRNKELTNTIDHESIIRHKNQICIRILEFLRTSYASLSSRINKEDLILVEEEPNNLFSERIHKAREEAILLINVLELRLRKMKEFTLLDEVLMIKSKIENPKFKIVLCGGYSTGKSMIANAIIGRSILPVEITPSTAVKTLLEYGDHEKVTIYIKNPLPSNLSIELTTLAREAINRNSSTSESPIMEVGISDLEDYVLLDSKNKKSDEGESPYDEVAINVKHPLLKPDISLIDTPGLFENKTRTEQAIKEIKSSHLILYTISAHQISSEVDKLFLENELGTLFRDQLLILINKMDDVGSNRERTKIENKGNFYGKYVEDGIKGVFFLSAKDGLQGKIKNYPPLLDDSAISTFEVYLQNFLIANRLYLQVLKPFFRIFRISEKLANELVIQGQLKKDKVTRFNNAKLEFEAVLKELKNKENKTSTVGLDKIRSIENKFEEHISGGLNDIRRKIRPWIDDMYVRTNLKFSLNNKKNRERAKELSEEFNDYIRPKIKSSIDTLFNNIKEWLADETEGVNNKIEELVDGINSNLVKLDSIIIRIRKIDIDVIEKNMTTEIVGWSNDIDSTSSWDFHFEEIDMMYVLELTLDEHPAYAIYSDHYDSDGFFALLLKVIWQLIGTLIGFRDEQKIIKKIKSRVSPIIESKFSESADSYSKNVIRTFRNKSSSQDSRIHSLNKKIGEIRKDLEKEKNRISESIQSENELVENIITHERSLQEINLQMRKLTQKY